MTNELFSSSQGDETEVSGMAKDDYMNGLKKRFTREDGIVDVEALMNAKAEADLFIKRLERENAGVRSELQTRVSMEELLDKLASRQNVTATNTATPGTTSTVDTMNPNQNTKALSEEDVAKLVESKLTKQQQDMLRRQNVETVRSKLQEMWGDDYASKLKQAVRELGTTEEYMAQLAETQPQFFLRTIQSVRPQTQTRNETVFTPPRSTVSVNAHANASNPSGTRTFKQYEAIRKSDPKLYWRPEIQNQMHKDAAAMGESFYN